MSNGNTNKYSKLRKFSNLVAGVFLGVPMGAVTAGLLYGIAGCLIGGLVGIISSTLGSVFVIGILKNTMILGAYIGFAFGGVVGSISGGISGGIFLTKYLMDKNLSKEKSNLIINTNEESLNF